MTAEDGVVGCVEAASEWASDGWGVDAWVTVCSVTD